MYYTDPLNFRNEGIMGERALFYKLNEDPTLDGVRTIWSANLYKIISLPPNICLPYFNSLEITTQFKD